MIEGGTSQGSAHELVAPDLGILPLIPAQCSLADLSHGLGSSVLGVVGRQPQKQGGSPESKAVSASTLPVVILQVRKACKLGTKLPPPRCQRLYQTAQSNAYRSILDGWGCSHHQELWV